MVTLRHREQDIRVVFWALLSLMLTARREVLSRLTVVASRQIQRFSRLLHAVELVDLSQVSPLVKHPHIVGCYLCRPSRGSVPRTRTAMIVSREIRPQ